MSDKAIFLDRDDTLIKDPGYISSPDQVELLDGVAEALIKLKELGYKLIVVSNQSAVARGIVNVKTLGQIHDRLKQLLAEKNAFIDRIYYCPYHPDGIVPKYRKESNDRKPNPGMLRKAAKDLNINLKQSWCIGNSGRDVEAGHRAGCKTILIDAPSRHKQTESQTGIMPDYRGVNIREAVNIIKKHIRSSAQKDSQVHHALKVKTEQVSQAEKPIEEAESAPKIDESIPEAEKPSSNVTESVSIAIETAEDVSKAAPQTNEDKPKRVPKKNRNLSPEQKTANNKTEQLLADILGQLKTMQRTEMFSEFSIMRLMAGIVQIIVLFCLLITIWFLMSPENQVNSIFIALGFAIVFQLMSLTLYIMHGRK